MNGIVNAALNLALGIVPSVSHRRREEAQRAAYEEANLASYDALMAEGFQPWPCGSFARQDGFSPYSHEYIAMTRVQPGKVWERNITINRMTDLAPEMNVAQMWWKPAEGFEKIIDGEVVKPRLLIEAS